MPEITNLHSQTQRGPTEKIAGAENFNFAFKFLQFSNKKNIF